MVCFNKCEHDYLNEKKIRKRTTSKREEETGEKRNKGQWTKLTTKTALGKGSKYIINSSF